MADLRTALSSDERPGIALGNHFYVWKKAVNAVEIAHGRLLLQFRSALFLFSLFFGAAMFVLYAVILMTGYGEDVLLADFWLMPNAVHVILLISITFLLFAYVRRLRDRERVEILPRVKIGDISREVREDAQSPSRDISVYADDSAEKTVEDAFLLAERAGSAEVTGAHLFSAALGTLEGKVLLARLGIRFDAIKDPLRRRLLLEEKGPTIFGVRAQAFLSEAFALALESKRTHISAREILDAARKSDAFYGELFTEAGVSPEDLEHALAWLRVNDDLETRYKTFRKNAQRKSVGAMNSAMTSIATPFLDALSEDLTRDAVYGHTEMLIGRETEVSSLFRAIEGGNTSVVLVGDAGVGRGAILEGIAELMAAEDVPQILKDKRLVKLSLPHLLHANGGQGAEERFLYALREVGRSGNIILVIENIDELVGAGSGGMDFAALLSTELEKRYTFVIATATSEGYREKIERSPLKTALLKIDISEPTRDESIRILEAKIGAIEARQHVAFTYAALASVVDLSMRYIHDRVLPDKAIELAREVALEAGKRGNGSALVWVSREDVARVIEEKTKVPVTEVKEDESAKLLSLEDKLHARVIGQESAISAISSALRRARTELRSEKRPIANFLFLGPTGVGKTELAKATAEVYFGSESSMIRFDMSEYQNKDSVSRLIGGNGQSGLLTEAIRKTPFALLLLDELEKAHPDILNIFLQVMDDGRLTDGMGRTVDFTNVILIATSNAGTQFITEELGKGMQVAAVRDGLLHGALKELFRPEFLNRFTDVIVFSPLSTADVTAIAYLLIAKLKERMEAKGVTLEVTDAAVHELAAQGYDPQFGARPLRRVLEEKVENVLADASLKGSFKRRDTLIFDAGGKFEVKKAETL